MSPIHKETDMSRSAIFMFFLAATSATASAATLDCRIEQIQNGSAVQKVAEWVAFDTEETGWNTHEAEFARSDLDYELKVARPAGSLWAQTSSDTLIGKCKIFETEQLASSRH